MPGKDVLNQVCQSAFAEDQLHSSFTLEAETIEKPLFHLYGNTRKT